MDFIGFKSTAASGHSNRLLTSILRLTVMVAAGVSLLALVLVGFLVVLPLMVVGGIASYFYLRRRVGRARQPSGAKIIDAEFTVVDRR